ncbi:MAG TPA: uroporphyrinogen-III synthase, partial [Rhodobacterales bacterium]|nr:uroporphyrinogen-III synthase [Rhodobacterales bacterium]
MKSLLVLTRPEMQSREIAAALGPEVAAIISPVMRIVAKTDLPDLGPYSGVILTSANGVVSGLDLTKKRAYCVGKRTAQAATEAGADLRLTARDADDLVSRIEGPGPLLHLRGEHARGHIAERLNSAGLETHEAVVYAQEALPLIREALDALAGDAPVVLPLYSPRSARLIGAQIGMLGGQVRTIAMSAAVAKEWAQTTGGAALIVPVP